MTCFDCIRRETDFRDRERGPGSYASWCQYRKDITAEDGEIIDINICQNFSPFKFYLNNNDFSCEVEL